MTEENVSRADRLEEALDSHGAGFVRSLYRVHHLSNDITQGIVILMVGFFALYGFMKFRHVLDEEDDE